MLIAAQSEDADRRSAPATGEQDGEDYLRIRQENLLSFVIVSIRDAGRDAAEIRKVARFAARDFTFYELLIVAALPPPGWTDAMRALGAEIPNLRVVVIESPQGYDELNTLALGSAIGDYIVSLFPGEVEEADLGHLIRMLASGRYDLVKAIHGPGPASRLEALSVRVIGGLIRMTTGQRIEPYQARAFAMSRTAASRLHSLSGTLKYFRILDVSSLLSQGHITVARPPRRRFLSAFNEKARLAADLISMSAERLIRSLAFTCFALAIVSFTVTLASFVTWTLMSDIAPGWTSLSMIFSFLFGANFAVLSAICLGLVYLIRQNAPERSDILTTELSGGDFFSRDDRLNVEAGAPDG